MCEFKVGDTVRVKDNYTPAILQGECGIILNIELGICAIDFGKEYERQATWNLGFMLPRKTGRFIPHYYLEVAKSKNDLEVELL